jgi:hypothetical protein
LDIIGSAAGASAAVRRGIKTMPGRGAFAPGAAWSGKKAMIGKPSNAAAPAVVAATSTGLTTTGKGADAGSAA